MQVYEVVGMVRAIFLYRLVLYVVTSELIIAANLGA